MFTKDHRLELQHQKHIQNLLRKQEEATNSILEEFLRKDNLEEIIDFIDSSLFDSLTNRQQRLVFQYSAEIESNQRKIV